MSVYNHRAMVPAMGGRVAELLEGIKAEFDSVSQEMSLCKLQRDELDHKLQQQLNEMSQFQATLYELERAHQKMKTQYEEEIHRLRRELEFRGVGGAGGAAAAAAAAFPAAGGPAAAGASSDSFANGSAPKRARTESGPPFPAPAPADDKDRESKSAIHALTSNTPRATSQSPSSVKASEGGSGGEAETGAQAKKEGADWQFTSKGPDAINIELAHNIEHTSVVCCIKFSADSKYLATGCNHTAQIFDVATGAKVAEFSDSSAVKDSSDLYIRSVCFSPDGQFLATGAEDKQIRIWDIKKNKVKLVFSGHEQDIYSLDFSRDGRFVCSGSGDKTARIWNMETGKCTYTLCDESNNKDAGVTSVAMSPDGRFVAAGSLDRVVRVWDARTGQFVERFEGHKDSVYSVAFSPDGRSLVSGSLDKTLKLWELGVGSKNRSPCRMTFEGHRDFVLSVAFSPDGRYVVSGSKDRSVQFWDPNTGVSQCVLQGHKNSVISVALSPDASYFATGSGDFKARIWRYEVAKN